MQKQLEILDSHLRISRPDFYSKLNTPLKESEIKALEEKYNIAIPDDLKKLYQWKNGQSDDCYDSFVNNSISLPSYCPYWAHKNLGRQCIDLSP